MHNEIKIVILDKAEDMARNFQLVKQLTASLTEEKYLDYLREMVPHNYFQITAIINNDVIGVSGYWIATKLYCGRYLEIDNFVVDEKYRSQQVGHRMMTALMDIARIHHCDVMMLDAYLQNTRAHRFYENHLFKAKGFHFIRKVTSDENTNECMQ